MALRQIGRTNEVEFSLDDLLSEKQVLERWSHLFVDKELRQARQNDLIDWYDLRKGPHYTEAGLSAYLGRFKRSPQKRPTEEADRNEGHSDSTGTGSTESGREAQFIATGMTPELAKSAADLLRKKIASRRSSRSQKSSSRRHAKGQETLRA